MYQEAFSSEINIFKSTKSLYQMLKNETGTSPTDAQNSRPTVRKSPTIDVIPIFRLLVPFLSE